MIVHHTFFTYRSLHLPNVVGQEPEYQLKIAKWAVARCGAAVALTHPIKIGSDYPTRCYEMMITDGVPLAIENMDLRKDSGVKVDELRRLVDITGCLFVFDAQHAYEHDPSMMYAGDLFESERGNLTHLHVSGETENSAHSLVYRARNAGTIVEFLGHVLNAGNLPLILEGEYKTVGELRREIEFLKKELGL